MAQSNTENIDGCDPLVKADSWFGSVKAVAVLAEKGIQSVMQVKNNHSLYPKKFIESSLKGAPGGVHIVLEGVHPNGQKLVAVGYRYSSRKTLMFRHDLMR